MGFTVFICYALYYYSLGLRFVILEVFHTNRLVLKIISDKTQVEVFMIIKGACYTFCQIASKQR